MQWSIDLTPALNDIGKFGIELGKESNLPTLEWKILLLIERLLRGGFHLSGAWLACN